MRFVVGDIVGIYVGEMVVISDGVSFECVVNTAGLSDGNVVGYFDEYIDAFNSGPQMDWFARYGLDVGDDAVTVGDSDDNIVVILELIMDLWWLSVCRCNRQCLQASFLPLISNFYVIDFVSIINIIFSSHWFPSYIFSLWQSDW